MYSTHMGYMCVWGGGHHTHMGYMCVSVGGISHVQYSYGVHVLGGHQSCTVLIWRVGMGTNRKPPLTTLFRITIRWARSDLLLHGWPIGHGSGHATDVNP